VSALVFETDWGYAVAAARERGLVRLTFGHATRSHALATAGVGGADGETALLAAVRAEVERYFRGERVALDFPVDLAGMAPFHRRALLAARAIPYGETGSYGWLAGRAGRPGAARAVGQAMARNPVSLVIPCHRVVGADGRLVGFGGGVDLKRRLLELESEPRQEGEDASTCAGCC
jgi:methylated-DNA-[protein]-cysteine S-methyltransferase